MKMEEIIALTDHISGLGARGAKGLTTNGNRNDFCHYEIV